MDKRSIEQEGVNRVHRVHPVHDVALLPPSGRPGALCLACFAQRESSRRLCSRFDPPGEVQIEPADAARYRQVRALVQQGPTVARNHAPTGRASRQTHQDAILGAPAQ